MKISLPPELEQFVQRQIGSAAYDSPEGEKLALMSDGAIWGIRAARLLVTITPQTELSGKSIFRVLTMMSY